MEMKLQETSKIDEPSRQNNQKNGDQIREMKNLWRIKLRKLSNLWRIKLRKLFLNKTRTESKKKRSLRVVVFFPMGNMKTKAYDKEMKGKKKLNRRQTEYHYHTCAKKTFSK